MSQSKTTKWSLPKIILTLAVAVVALFIVWHLVKILAIFAVLVCIVFLFIKYSTRRKTSSR